MDQDRSRQDKNAKGRHTEKWDGARKGPTETGRMGQGETGEPCTPESWLRAAPGLLLSMGLRVFSGDRGCMLSGPWRRLLTGSCWAQGWLGPG